MSKPFAALVGAGAVLGALLILFSTGSASPTHAAVDINTIAIDTNITGNVATQCNTGSTADYPCNSSTVLGPIDTCAAIAVGATVQIDIVGSGIPAGGAAASDLSHAGAGQFDGALDWSPN